MSLLNSRLTKLEAASLKESNKISHVARFIVNPGPVEVAGYSCNGRDIWRLPEEAIEDLRKRCIESITPADDMYLLFKPLYVLQTKQGGSHVID